MGQYSQVEWMFQGLTPVCCAAAMVPSTLPLPLISSHHSSVMRVSPSCIQDLMLPALRLPEPLYQLMVKLSGLFSCR